MKILAVVDPRIAVGFRLTGIEVLEATSGEAAMPYLSAMMQQHEIGIVLYNEEYWESFPEAFREKLTKSEIPLFFQMPSSLSGEDTQRTSRYMASLLRRTIGYQIRLQ